MCELGSNFNSEKLRPEQTPGYAFAADITKLLKHKSVASTTLFGSRFYLRSTVLLLLLREADVPSQSASIAGARSISEHLPHTPCSKPLSLPRLLVSSLEDPSEAV